MKSDEYPLNEDFYIGENPKNLPHYYEQQSQNDDFAEPLPDKYLSRFPEYFKIFCKPYISITGEVKFNIQLSNEFISAIKIHYNLKQSPSRQELCTILESELKKCLKDF